MSTFVCCRVMSIQRKTMEKVFSNFIKMFVDNNWCASVKDIGYLIIEIRVSVFKTVPSTAAYRWQHHQQTTTTTSSSHRLISSNEPKRKEWVRFRSLVDKSEFYINSVSNIYLISQKYWPMTKTLMSIQPRTCHFDVCCSTSWTTICWFNLKVLLVMLVGTIGFVKLR